MRAELSISQTVVKTCNVIVSLFQDACCIYVPMEWTPLKHTWFLLPTSIENVEEQKNVCNWSNQRYHVIGAHTICL